MGIKSQVLKFRWNRWLQRPFKAFLASLFVNAGNDKYFKRFGAEGIRWDAMLYQNGYWYDSPDMYNLVEPRLEQYLQRHSVFDLSRSLNKFYSANKKKIKGMCKKVEDPISQLQELYDIFSTIAAYVMMTHGIEHALTKKAHLLVPQFVFSDTDTFIGNASFPKKKNMHARMEREIRMGKDARAIARKYGWIRSRNGFDDSFSPEDIENMRAHLSVPVERKKVVIPAPLQPLFTELRELVWFRTARTDVLYEFLFLSRPILRRVAEHYNIPFNELQYYTIQSLIDGDPCRYNNNFSVVFYCGAAEFSNEPVLAEGQLPNGEYVTGKVAFQGNVIGHVKIIRSPTELHKVNPGDVLVAPMTVPSYVTAMQRASAFVTDEGGITCHAAIVSREMQKPCIVGTKVATHVFKDGDLVEVDGDKGIVRKVNK